MIIQRWFVKTMLRWGKQTSPTIPLLGIGSVTITWDKPFIDDKYIAVAVCFNPGGIELQTLGISAMYADRIVVRVKNIGSLAGTATVMAIAIRSPV